VIVMPESRRGPRERGIRGRRQRYRCRGAVSISQSNLLEAAAACWFAVKAGSKICTPQIQNVMVAGTLSRWTRCCGQAAELRSVHPSDRRGGNDGNRAALDFHSLRRGPPKDVVVMGIFQMAASGSSSGHPAASWRRQTCDLNLAPPHALHRIGQSAFRSMGAEGPSLGVEKGPSSFRDALQKATGLHTPAKPSALMSGSQKWCADWGIGRRSEPGRMDRTTGFPRQNRKSQPPGIQANAIGALHGGGRRFCSPSSRDAPRISGGRCSSCAYHARIHLGHGGLVRSDTTGLARAYRRARHHPLPGKRVVAPE